MTDVRAIGRLDARELSKTKSHAEAVRPTPPAETCAAPMYRNILIATDGSALAEKAVTTGSGPCQGISCQSNGSHCIRGVGCRTHVPWLGSCSVRRL